MKHLQFWCGWCCRCCFQLITRFSCLFSHLNNSISHQWFLIGRWLTEPLRRTCLMSGKVDLPEHVITLFHFLSSLHLSFTTGLRAEAKTDTDAAYWPLVRKCLGWQRLEDRAFFSIFHDAEEIRNANNPGYHHGVMGDTFIVGFMTGRERRNSRKIQQKCCRKQSLINHLLLMQYNTFTNDCESFLCFLWFLRRHTCSQTSYKGCCIWTASVVYNAVSVHPLKTPFRVCW